MFSMKLLQLPGSTTQTPPRLSKVIVAFSSFCAVYVLLSLFLVRSSIPVTNVPSIHPLTSLEHIVFGIASNQNSWTARKEYVKMWWKPEKMRGCVFVDSLPSDNSNSSHNERTSLPPLCVSEDTSGFRYTYRNGLRSAIRVARVVSETVALNHSNVRWFVFGDDDTIFFPENLMKTLSKYDHELWYYIGTNSEIHEQNRIFSFEMAFGGAGFAISYPLAKVLSKVFDSCIERYPHLYGSDSRVHSCLAELGVGLTREPGFHQLDVRGDMFGILAAHPITPILSLHHLEHTDPIFPNATTYNSLQHLFKAANVDQERLLQQTVCYDPWFFWTVSISWGYAVQVFEKHLNLADAVRVQETFRQWKRANTFGGVYGFNTREIHPDPCARPTVFFFEDVFLSKNGVIKTTYRKNASDDCWFNMATSPKKFQEIRVFSEKLDLTVRQLKAPRRQCCDILPPSVRSVMEIAIRDCKQEELIHL